MLVIGHRGAAGLAPENTLEAMEAGAEVGADMLEFDVRLTRDRQPVIIHDIDTRRTHKIRKLIPLMTLKELRAEVPSPVIPTLDEVLDKFFGKVLLNIELKSRGTGPIVVSRVRKHVKKDSDWDNVLVSSFHGRELVRSRRASRQVNLALLHDRNPFLFVAYHRTLHLTAVGFHRLYINRFALEIAKRAGIFTYVYTVNRPVTARMMGARGIDGIVSDRPDIIIKALNTTKKLKKTKKK